MAKLNRSKLLMQEDLEKRARKKTSSDLRHPRKRGPTMRGYGKAYMKGGKVK